MTKKEYKNLENKKIDSLNCKFPLLILKSSVFCTFQNERAAFKMDQTGSRAIRFKKTK